MVEILNEISVKILASYVKFLIYNSYKYKHYITFYCVLQELIPHSYELDLSDTTILNIDSLGLIIIVETSKYRDERISFIPCNRKEYQY